MEPETSRKRFSSCCGKFFLPSLLRFLFLVFSMVVVIVIAEEIYYKRIQATTLVGDKKFAAPYHPNQNPIDLDYQNYTVLLDSHSHTPYLKGEDNIKWHLANSYNAMFLTEHNSIAEGVEMQKIAREKYADKIKVFVGMEWTNCRVHMNFLNIKTQINNTENSPTDARIQEVIGEVHKQGGLVVANHYVWSLQNGLINQPTREQFMQWGVDFFAPVNNWNFDYKTYQFAVDNNMGVLTSTDLHQSNSAHGWTTLIPKNFSEEAIWEELLNKRTSIIYDLLGSPDPLQQSTIENPWFNVLYFFKLVADFTNSFYQYRTGIYSFVSGYCLDPKVILRWDRIWWSLGWFFALFIVFETILMIVTALFRKIKKKISDRRGTIRFRKSGAHFDFDDDGDDYNIQLLQKSKGVNMS